MHENNKNEFFIIISIIIVIVICNLLGWLYSNHVSTIVNTEKAVLQNAISENDNQSVVQKTIDDLSIGVKRIYYSICGIITNGFISLFVLIALIFPKYCYKNTQAFIFKFCRFDNEWADRIYTAITLFSIASFIFSIYNDLGQITDLLTLGKEMRGTLSVLHINGIINELGTLDIP